MPKRRLHPFRPLYSWLLLWSFFVLQKRRTEHPNRINGFGSSCVECCSPMINRGTVMVSLVGIFLVHLLHGFILPPGNSTGGRLLIIENRRSLSFMPYGDVRSLSISYVVLAWIIHVIRNKLVISVKNPLIFHDVQSTKLRFMKGIEYTFLRYLWYIEWRIWDPGITNSKRRVGSRREIYYQQSHGGVSTKSTILSRTQIRTNGYRVDVSKQVRDIMDFFSTIWEKNKMPKWHTYRIRDELWRRKITNHIFC